MHERLYALFINKFGSMILTYSYQMSTGFPQRVCRKEKVMSSSSDKFLKGFFNQSTESFICDGKYGVLSEFLYAVYVSIFALCTKSAEC